MRAILTMVLLAATLLGCRGDVAPVVSGSVVDGGLFLGEFAVKRADHQVMTWELTPAQLEQVTVWLTSHRDGWDRIVASPPPPSFSILLNHEDGTRSRIDLFDFNDSWRGAIVLHAADASNNGMRHISVQERESLLAIVKKSL